MCTSSKVLTVVLFRLTLLLFKSVKFFQVKFVWFLLFVLFRYQFLYYILLISFVGVLENTEFCISVPKAPSVAIHISEFPNDDVIPIGYNLTVVCTGNSSKEGDSHPLSEQPFSVQLYFKTRKIKECGGIYSDREEIKTCKLRIKEASRNNSGQYGCIVTNSLRCIIAELTVNLKGGYFYKWIIIFISSWKFKLQDN